MDSNQRRKYANLDRADGTDFASRLAAGSHLLSDECEWADKAIDLLDERRSETFDGDLDQD